MDEERRKELQTLTKSQLIEMVIGLEQVECALEEKIADQEIPDEGWYD